MAALQVHKVHKGCFEPSPTIFLPTPVQVFTAGTFSSAQQVAEQLNSSLERGLCENALALGRRAAAFGVNRLPERDQVGMPHFAVGI